MIATNFCSYRTALVLPHRVNVKSYEQKSNLSQLADASSSTILCSSWHRSTPRVAIASCGTDSGTLRPDAVRIRAICHLAASCVKALAKSKAGCEKETDCNILVHAIPLDSASGTEHRPAACAPSGHSVRFRLAWKRSATPLGAQTWRSMFRTPDMTGWQPNSTALRAGSVLPRPCNRKSEI